MKAQLSWSPEGSAIGENVHACVLTNGTRCKSCKERGQERVSTSVWIIITRYML